MSNLDSKIGLINITGRGIITRKMQRDVSLGMLPIVEQFLFQLPYMALNSKSSHN